MRIFCELRSIFPSPSYYMLNHQIRGSLFHYKKNCYFAIGLYFFGKSIQKHPDVGNACLQESIPHKCHKGKGIIQGKLYSQVH